MLILSESRISYIRQYHAIRRRQGKIISNMDFDLVVTLIGS